MALFASEKRRATSGGALGAVAAVASAHLGLWLRAGERPGVLDPVLGLLKDGLVLFFGELLLRKDA